MKKKKVAIVGIQGVPAKYGGFESLVDNLLSNNYRDETEYTVFCSSKDMPEKIKSYKGAKLKYVPFKANGAQSVIYDALCLARCIRGYDTVLILGVSGCWCLPIFRHLFRGKIVVNIDGLEHRREKWKPWVRRFLRYSEAKAVKYGNVIIADNKGISDYVRKKYGRSSELIAYGGDHAMRTLDENKVKSILKKYGLKEGEYAITVCRIEPENNSRLVLDAFSRTDYPLLYIGNWDHSEYSRKVREDYSRFKNLLLVDGIYDLDILYALRSKASLYIHGHSAGGTNPSLVEAMTLGKTIIAYDVIYNRETTEGKALYFKNIEDLERLIKANIPENGTLMSGIASKRYRWKDIAQQYVALY